MNKDQKLRKQRALNLKKERIKMLSKHKTRFDNVDGFIQINKENSKPYIRSSSDNIPSLNTYVCDTSKRNKMEYTGTKLLGIATMHKSNMVPVFSSEEATEISKMRRG